MVSSQLPAIQVAWSMGGLYLATPGSLDAQTPWADLRVRQAMNRAIDREVLNTELFNGRGEFMPVLGFHPSLAGWDSEWVKGFPEMYGYNPELARELLAEAGYPDGFKFKPESTDGQGWTA